MAYLRVECPLCHIYWNFYDEMFEQYPQQTAINYQGCVCPSCGLIGYIPGKATDNTKEALKWQK